MVTITKKEPENINDPVDIMQKLSRLIHQQEERIARLIEMEASDPKLSLQIDRAMRVLDTLLQHYRNMACDLGLMTRVPKVMPVIDTFPTPAQAKFRDQTMRGLRANERAKEEALREAAWEEAQVQVMRQSFRDASWRSETAEEFKKALHEAFNTIYWKRKEEEEQRVLH